MFEYQAGLRFQTVARVDVHNKRLAVVLPAFVVDANDNLIVLQIFQPTIHYFA